MPRFAYVNGRYLRHGDATVHIEDRGYQFADGIYEVIHVRAGRMIDAEPHFDRFDRSLGELAIRPPMSRAALTLVLRELLALNGIENGLLYFQATRGVAPRDHKFPQHSKTTLVATAKLLKPLAPAHAGEGCVGHHHSGHPLAALRHQIPGPAAQCAGQAAGGDGGRL